MISSEAKIYFTIKSSIPMVYVIVINNTGLLGILKMLTHTSHPKLNSGTRAWHNKLVIRNELNSFLNSYFYATVFSKDVCEKTIICKCLPSYLSAFIGKFIMRMLLSKIFQPIVIKRVKPIKSNIPSFKKDFLGSCSKTREIQIFFKN